MIYCTQCGRKLPHSGECPYCTNRYLARKTQLMVQAVQEASGSYTTLALACVWSLSLLCVLVFSVMAISPLLLAAIPGIAVVVGLWMVYVGQGHTCRLGYTFISAGLQAMSILTALALATLCLMNLWAIFQCTSYQSYSNVSTGMLLLSVYLLVALPVVSILLHKLRRIAVTTRSILLRSRYTADVPLLAMVGCLAAGLLTVYASVHLNGADRFLQEVRPMVLEELPSLYASLFYLLSGSWSGMMIPLMLVALSFVYTAIVLGRYRLRLGTAWRKMRRAESKAKAEAAQKTTAEKRKAEKE